MPGKHNKRLKNQQRIGRRPLKSERVRSIDGSGFSFMPNRFLREFFAVLQPDELLLYFLLVLASDRLGMSFYHYDSLCSLLQMPIERYLTARNSLIEKDLIAFDGTRFQVLSLPERPVGNPSRLLQTPEDFEKYDGATVHSIITSSFGGDS
jgi:hypothetical protein